MATSNTNMEVPSIDGDECIRVATKWGTVFLRYDDLREFWTKTIAMPSRDLETMQWYESRCYAPERRKLLENEHSVYKLKLHPNAGDD